MSIKPDALLTLWAARLAGISGWKRSAQPYDAFGRTASGMAHLGFALKLAEMPPIEQHQFASDGITCLGQMRVRVGFKQRPSEKNTCEGEAWEQLRLGIKRVITRESPTWPSTQTPVLANATLDLMQGGEWFVGDLVFNVQFSLDLS